MCYTDISRSCKQAISSQALHGCVCHGTALILSSHIWYYLVTSRSHPGVCLCYKAVTCHCSHELGVTIHLECCYVMQDCLQRGTGLSLCQQTDQQHQPSTVSTNTVCKATARHVTNCRGVSATVGSGAQLSRWCWSWRRWLMSWSRRSTRE